jgi:membrane protein
MMPDTKVRWKHAWKGALITALLFTFGKVLIGFYLGQSALASTYGASASVVIILLWTYYSTLILLFGAEVVKTLQFKSIENSGFTSA